jgi:hypothetical protein
MRVLAAGFLGVTTWQRVCETFDLAWSLYLQEGCPMGLETVTTTFTFADAVLRYFSPSRSPYYLVVVAAVAALVLSCAGLEREGRWYAVALPAVVVLAVSLALALVTRGSFSPEEQEEQLRFVRAMSISAALLWMVFVVRSVQTDRTAFLYGYGASLVQTTTFLLYILARSGSRDPHEGVNLVQLSLITTALLSGGCAALVQRSGLLDGLAPGAEPPVEARRYFIVAQALYGLWAVCILFWIRHLASHIRISVRSAAISE